MKKIKIINNGPYLVTGNIPLQEMVIVATEEGNIYKEEKQFPLQETYALCRCGKSKNSPYCDGSHLSSKFKGNLTARKDKIANYATKYEGERLILKDSENLCAFARFCHNQEGDIWNLTELSTSPKEDELVIDMASKCPAGRLVIIDKKTNKEIEPLLKKTIMVLQDPSRKCSGPLWVRGKIPIENDTGVKYEVRNRVTLCRCGHSTNKPFCDASHVNEEFNDGILKI